MALKIIVLLLVAIILQSKRNGLVISDRHWKENVAYPALMHRLRRAMDKKKSCAHQLVKSISIQASKKQDGGYEMSAAIPSHNEVIKCFKLLLEFSKISDEGDTNYQRGYVLNVNYNSTKISGSSFLVNPISYHSHFEIEQNFTHTFLKAKSLGFAELSFIIHLYRRSAHLEVVEVSNIRAFFIVFISSNCNRESVLHRRKRELKSVRKKLESIKWKLKEIQTPCHMQELYVDFRAIGWDNWIIAPAGYWAHFCRGTCLYPLADHMNGTNHAVVQALVHSNNYVTPQPSCTATRLSPKSILYVQNSKSVALEHYNDMIVEECGCR